MWVNIELFSFNIIRFITKKMSALFCEEIVSTHSETMQAGLGFTEYYLITFIYKVSGR